MFVHIGINNTRASVCRIYKYYKYIPQVVIGGIKCKLERGWASTSFYRIVAAWYAYANLLGLPKLKL